MPTPSDSKLYAEVKALADKKFVATTSAYKSAWIVREYKKRGGLYKEDGNKQGLTQWFQEKWVDLERPKKNKSGNVIGYEPCGRSSAQKDTPGKYPLCRPSKRVNASTPKTVQEVPKERIPVVAKSKQRVREKGRIAF